MAAVTSAALASLLAAASLRERALRKLRHERSLLQATANSQLPSHILLSPSVHIKDAAHIQQLAVSDDALLRALGDFLQGVGAVLNPPSLWLFMIAVVSAGWPQSVQPGQGCIFTSEQRRILLCNVLRAGIVSLALH